MDEHSEAGIPVFTTDASGTGGGGHFRHMRFAHSYPEELRAPNKSSNFREFDTGLRGTQQLVAEQGWKDERVLWRTDNDVSRCIVNNQGTMAPELCDTSQHLNELCRSHILDLAAAHISGVDNDLVDKLTRHQWHFETGDWKLVEPVFWYIMHLLGFKCSLDGAADIVGSNSYLPVYCSVVESLFDRSVEGEDVFANCDYNIMKEYRNTSC
jgi:hypothetical protein